MHTYIDVKSVKDYIIIQGLIKIMSTAFFIFVMNT